MFNFVMKQLLKNKMKDVPAADQEKIFAMIEKNPQFFTEIATKIKSKMDQGKGEQTAMMEIMEENKSEFELLNSDLRSNK